MSERGQRGEAPGSLCNTSGAGRGRLVRATSKLGLEIDPCPGNARPTAHHQISRPHPLDSAAAVERGVDSSAIAMTLNARCLNSFWRARHRHGTFIGDESPAILFYFVHFNSSSCGVVDAGAMVRS
jgi:hypothetical protein